MLAFRKILQDYLDYFIFDLIKRNNKKKLCGPLIGVCNRVLGAMLTASDPRPSKSSEFGGQGYTCSQRLGGFNVSGEVCAIE